MQRPLRPGCRARARGFTLLELTAVLALSAIVVLLAVPSFAGAVARHRLQAAAEQLAHDLADARFEAAQRGTALHLSFATGTQWCYALALQAGCDCRAAAPCQISRVQAGDHPGVRLLHAEDARVDPLPGRSTGGDALLEAADAAPLRVALSPLGRPRICAPGGNVRGYPAC